MEELNQLVGSLKENIQPEIAQKLLSGFAEMRPEAQERVLKGLRQDVEIRNLIHKYQAERQQAVNAGLGRMREIEKGYALKQKDAVHQLEKRTESTDAREALSLINQI